jgi:hypothetical protein
MSHKMAVAWCVGLCIRALKWVWLFVQSGVNKNKTLSWWLDFDSHFCGVSWWWDLCIVALGSVFLTPLFSPFSLPSPSSRSSFLLSLLCVSLPPLSPLSLPRFSLALLSLLSRL